MTVLSRLASAQGAHDDVPNQELARDLAEREDRAAVAELAAHLRDRNQAVRSDCLKTLYEVGYLRPELIADYTGEFLSLLRDKNNRMIWGAAIALATIAGLRADAIFEQRKVVLDALTNGSVITVDNAVKTLADVASTRDEYRDALLPELLRHLATCRPKDVAPHSEAVVKAVNARYVEQFIETVEARRDSLSPSQLTRVKRVIREAERRGIAP